jgi:GH25 family lysozyme M1 (1,4-beta-N-acetylmuramidase)
VALLARSKPVEKLAVEKPGIVFADLSNNQSEHTFHAETYCTTHPFLIHKATQGTNFTDDLHASRSEEVHAHGRAVGHYMFLESGSDPITVINEIHHFLQVIEGHVLTQWPGKPHGYKADFLIFDFEVNCTQPNGVIARIHKMLSKAYPTIPVIGYANYFRIRELGLVIPVANPRWWVAAYPGPVTSLPNGQRIWSHQYTNQGRVQGISVPCDKSVIVNKEARRYWT